MTRDEPQPSKSRFAHEDSPRIPIALPGWRWGFEPGIAITLGREFPGEAADAIYFHAQRKWPDARFTGAAEP